MKKPIFGLLVGIALTLISCGTLSMPRGSCQANTTDLMPSNRVPANGQLKRAAYSGNENEGIVFLTVGTDLSAEDLLQHYDNQTQAERSDWTLLDSETTVSVALSSWKVVDSCGDPWNGTITVSKPSSLTDPFVTIRVIRAR